MKLLYVMETFPPNIDGVVRFSGNIVPELTKEFDVEVLAPNYGTQVKEYWGAPVTLFPVFKLIKIEAGFPYYPVLPTPRLYRKIRKSDVVFIQSLPYLGAGSVIISKILRKPIVMYFHQIGWEQLAGISGGPKWFQDLLMRFVKIQMRFFCNFLDLIMVPNEAMIDVLNEAGIRTKKETVRLGVDHEKFKPGKSKKEKIGIDKEQIVIGFTGRISGEKNVATLVDAFEKLDVDNCKLLLVGDGEEAHKYSQQKNVIVTGFVDNIVPYYQSMDIFVMPSLTETTGLSTIEAMSCGLPVITTPVGIALTAISDGYNALLFSKHDVDVLADHIKDLIDDKKKRKELGKNARDTIVEGYTWSHTVEKIKKILNDLQ